MGNSHGTEEQQLAEAEKDLGLEGVSPQAVYTALQSFLPNKTMRDLDFQHFAQTLNLPITSHVEFFDALKESVHRYKPKLTLMTFTLYSGASQEDKVDVMYRGYCGEGPADKEMLKKLVYNMIDVSVNVSRRLFSSDFKIRDYAQNLRKGRELLLSTIDSALQETPVSREAFQRVLTSPQFSSLLTPSGVRKRLQELVSSNTSRLAGVPVIPAAAR